MFYVVTLLFLFRILFSVQVDSVDESSSETDTDDELNAFGAVGGIDYDDQDKDTYEGHCPTFDERPMDESRHNHKHIQYKRRGRMVRVKY